MNASSASFLTWDKILKDILADPVCIRQLLQDYLCSKKMSKALDYEHLEQISSEFIDSKTRRYYYGDMIWKIAFKDRRKRPLYLVMLLELQSRSCHHMALRMLNYLTQFCLSLINKLPKKEAFPLPQIIPAVLYVGWPRWRGPLEVGRLWTDGNGQPGRAAMPVKFRFKLIDVARAKLKGSKTSLFRRLLDCLQTNKLDTFQQKWDNFQEFAPSLGDSFNGDAWLQLFGMVLKQISEVDMNTELTLEQQYPHVTAKDINDRLDAEGNMICWRTRYIAQGREEGRAQGREEGREEGKAEGRAQGKTEGKLLAITASLRSLMETLGLSLQEAMNALRIPEAEQQYYREQLS